MPVPLLFQPEHACPNEMLTSDDRKMMNQHLERRGGLGLQRALSQRFRVNRQEAGFTLIELLVASAMGVVLLGAVSSMVISAMRSQPDLSKKSQNISEARWVLERLTREIRNGVRIDSATASSVSFQTYVRHVSCGSTAPLPSASPSIKCEVTYSCSSATCTRTETVAGVLTGGTPRTIFSGINDANVFSYEPKSGTPTYIGVKLRMPNPDGSSALTVSDGASLRNATLAQ
jgi:prepilin-type N-terminal cleavage/methylation domain-containing protein